MRTRCAPWMVGFSVPAPVRGTCSACHSSALSLRLLALPEYFSVLSWCAICFCRCPWWKWRACRAVMWVDISCLGLSNMAMATSSPLYGRPFGFPAGRRVFCVCSLVWAGWPGGWLTCFTVCKQKPQPQSGAAHPLVHLKRVGLLAALRRAAAEAPEWWRGTYAFVRRVACQRSSALRGAVLIAVPRKCGRAAAETPCDTKAHSRGGRAAHVSSVCRSARARRALKVFD